MLLVRTNFLWMLLIRNIVCDVFSPHCPIIFLVEKYHFITTIRINVSIFFLQFPPFMGPLDYWSTVLLPMCYVETLRIFSGPTGNFRAPGNTFSASHMSEITCVNIWRLKTLKNHSRQPIKKESASTLNLRKTEWFVTLYYLVCTE